MPDVRDQNDANKEQGQAGPTPRCVACGYDLRGLAADAVCPECGTPTAETFAGRHINRSHPAWIAQTAAGAKLLAWTVALWPAAVLAVVVAGLAGLIAGERAIEILWWRWPWLVGGAVAAELALGWWFLTPPERLEDGSAVRGRWAWARRLTRALSAAAALCVACAAALTLVGYETVTARFVAPGRALWGSAWVVDGALIGLAAIAGVCMVGAHLGGMRCASRLAGRTRRMGLSRRLDRLARMPVRLSVFYVGAWVCLPLVALADLITGLLSLIYVAAFNLLTPMVLIGIVIASGRALGELSSALVDASRRAHGGGVASGVRTGAVGGR